MRPGRMEMGMAKDEPPNPPTANACVTGARIPPDSWLVSMARQVDKAALATRDAAFAVARSTGSAGRTTWEAVTGVFSRSASSNESPARVIALLKDLQQRLTQA